MVGVAEVWPKHYQAELHALCAFNEVNLDLELVSRRQLQMVICIPKNRES